MSSAYVASQNTAIDICGGVTLSSSPLTAVVKALCGPLHMRLKIGLQSQASWSGGELSLLLC